MLKIKRSKAFGVEKNSSCVPFAKTIWLAYPHAAARIDLRHAAAQIRVIQSALPNALEISMKCEQGLGPGREK